MNILPREKKIDIIAALSEGVGVRATARLVDVDRKTVARLALQIGKGCAELHDRMFVGLRVHRCELDELWAFVGCKQKHVEREDLITRGDQYTFLALDGSSRAIIAYHTGKRDTENTDAFIQDLRQRVIGAPEISTDGFPPYKNAIRHAFGNRIAHGTIVKTYSAGEVAVVEASRRYSPAAVVAVTRDVVSGVPAHISTSYVERQNLSVRMTTRRFTRLTNGFSRKAGIPSCSDLALRRSPQSLQAARGTDAEREATGDASDGARRGGSRVVVWRVARCGDCDAADCACYDGARSAEAVSRNSGRKQLDLTMGEMWRQRNCQANIGKCSQEGLDIGIDIPSATINYQLTNSATPSTKVNECQGSI